MGTRLRKEIGYGVIFDNQNDFIAKTNYIRSDLCGYELPQNKAELTLKDFLVYAKTGNILDAMDISGLTHIIKNHPNTSMEDIFRYVYDEKENIKAILFQYPGYKDWSRYADPIDYMEIEALPEPDRYEFEFRYHDIPIYPFLMCYVNARTGQPVDLKMGKMMMDIHFQENESLCKQYGFENYEDYLENISVGPPSFFRELALAFDIFKDPIIAKTMRPMYIRSWT